MDLFIPQGESPQPLELTENFSEMYHNLRSFSCFSKIKLENEEKFFKKFKKLEKLELCNNGLTSLPPTIAKLKSLQWLEISHNEISLDNIIECFQKLSSLKIFAMNNLKFEFTKEKSLVKIPKSLKSLLIKNSTQNCIPFDIVKSELTHLNFCGVGLIDIDKINKRNPLSLKYAAEFYKNIFSEEQLDSIFSIIHESRTAYLDVNETLKLNALVFKKFPRLGDDFQSSGISNEILSIKTLTVSFFN